MYGVKDPHGNPGTAPEAPSCRVSQRVMPTSIILLVSLSSTIPIAMGNKGLCAPAYCVVMFPA